MVQQPPFTITVGSPTSPDVIVNLPPSPSSTPTIVTLIIPVVAAILAAFMTHVFAQWRAKADTKEAHRRDELGHAATMLAAAIPWVRAAQVYIVRCDEYDGDPDGKPAERLAQATEKINAADKEFLFARTAAGLIISNPVVKDCIKQVKDCYDSFAGRFEQARKKVDIQESLAECQRFRELIDALNDSVAATYSALPNTVAARRSSRTSFAHAETK
ncbi:hypothetical protein DMA12_45685 [Amycolatopsis balhimycina DSM 5908]|uniref:Uncharacterized protein n=1 Tax=Amycolatopsis balhimycina DSM 5908 TaxID=1081091 RepID=A0A428VW67_AMYBA|nr:hypothetical protein [Amycolatopsis balhimycina]RSM35075.1 hypothetical protein DMA12_45685 [Amycolatopsis balhimycina DSM 5908]